jgi:hypothetical protein
MRHLASMRSLALLGCLLGVVACNSNQGHVVPPNEQRSVTMAMPGVQFVDSVDEISDPMLFRLEDGSFIPQDLIERSVRSSRVKRGYWFDRFDVHYQISGIDISPKEFARTIYKTSAWSPSPVETASQQHIQIENRFSARNLISLRTRFPLQDPSVVRIQVRPVTLNSECGISMAGLPLIDDLAAVQDPGVASLSYSYDPSELLEGQIYEVVWSNLVTDVLAEPLIIRKLMVLAPGDTNGDAQVNDEDLNRFMEKANLVYDSGDASELWAYDFLNRIEQGDPIQAALDNEEFLRGIVADQRRLKTPIHCLQGRSHNINPIRLVTEVNLPEYSERIVERFAVDLEYKNNVLVAFNENDPDGLELARYYQSKRSLDSNQICGLKLPFGDFATFQQLIEAKSKLHACICNLVTSGQGCSEKTPEQLSEISPITHLVFVGVIPIRMIETGWESGTLDRSSTGVVTADEQMPVFQYHLAASLYDSRITSEDYEGEEFNPFQYGALRLLGESTRQQGDRTSVRLAPLQAPLGLAYGNIRAATKERTKDLIDQYVQSEALGFRGNAFVGQISSEDWNTNRQREALLSSSNPAGFLIRTLGQDAEKCSRYVGDEILSWDHLECRVGVDGLGRIPGERGSDVQNVLNASIYIGNEHKDNSHAGFEDWQTMMQWRASDQSCVALCREFPEESQREQCRNDSKDIYREINSACVAVNPSFLGWQYRSWTVQYRGTFVNGWNGTEYGFGPKTPPEWLAQGGAPAPNGNTGFIRFGKNANLSSATQNCETTSDVRYACQSPVPISFERVVTLPAGLAFAAGDTVELRLSHRAWAATGQLTAGVALESASGTYPLVVENRIGLGSFEAGRWIESVKVNAVSSEVTGGRRAKIYLYASIANGIRGAIDVDEIEVMLVSPDGSRLALLGNQRGDFSQVITEKTTAGDWAGQIIDRMGGLGAWGSASHHVTGGHAFAGAIDLVATLFSGRSLGESLIQAGRPQSGLVFVDPVYRPYGVKIFTETAMRKMGSSARLNASMLATRDEIFLTAFNGRSPHQTWRFEICTSARSDASCEMWQGLLAGTGPIDELRSGFFLEDFIVDDRVDQTVLLRLTTTAADSSASTLHDTVKITYSSDR